MTSATSPGAAFEPGARLRITFQMFADNDRQGVETLSHVGRVEAEINLRGGMIQHGKSSTPNDGREANAENRFDKLAESVAGNLTT